MKPGDRKFTLWVIGIIVVGILVYLGKISSVTLEPKKITIEASPSLNKDSYRKMLQEELQGFKKELKSSKKDEQENRILLKQIGGLEAKLANVEKALADRKKVLAETEQALAGEKLKNAIPENQLKDAQQKLAKGDSSEAEALLAQVLKEAETHVNAGAEAAYRLGNLAYDRIDFRAARKYFNRAVQLAPGNSLYLNQAGFVANILADHDKAIGYYEKALASDLKTFGPDHPKVAIRLNNLGEVWRAKGNYDKAIGYYEKALASDLKTFGPDHPHVATYWNNLGLAWKAKGEHDKAIGYFEQALAIYEKANLPHRVKLVKDNIAALKKRR